MKTTLFTALAIAALGSTTAVMGMETAAPDSQTTVEFLEPEKFTDFRTSDMGGSSDQAALQKELRKEIERLAGRHLPQGYRLHLRFRDIDMAGAFEPWRAPSFSDVRINRDTYPPRMHVEYSVTDASGEVVASGERKLSDLAYLNRLHINRDDPLVHEIALVDDFIRNISRPLS